MAPVDARQPRAQLTDASPVFARKGYPLRYSTHSILWPERRKSLSQPPPVVVTVGKGIALRGDNALARVSGTRRIEDAVRVLSAPPWAERSVSAGLLVLLDH